MVRDPLPCRVSPNLDRPLDRRPGSVRSVSRLRELVVNAPPAFAEGQAEVQWLLLAGFFVSARGRKRGG
jgi:hypothetical protein